MPSACQIERKPDATIAPTETADVSPAPKQKSACEIVRKWISDQARDADRMRRLCEDPLLPQLQKILDEEDDVKLREEINNLNYSIDKIPSNPPKVKVTLKDDSEQVEPEDLEIKIRWRPDYQQTSDEVLLQIDLERTESQLRMLCLDRDNSPWLTYITSWLYPAQLAPPPNSLYKFLKKLAAIGQETLGATPPQRDRAREQISLLLGEATIAFAMQRRSEIIWRFANALIVTLLLLIGFRLLLSLLNSMGLMRPSVAVPEDKSALTIVFFAGTAVGAWLSYVQRSMSNLDRSLAGDLDDLRSLVMDTVHPAARTFYVFAFAFIGLLFFHLGVVAVDLGDFRTANVLSEFKVALLAGLLLGLAERTLPEAIGRRAQVVTAGFGGGGGANVGGGPAPHPGGGGGRVDS